MKTVIIAAMSLALFASTALADPPPGRGKGKAHRDDGGASAVSIDLAVVFSPQERDVINTYFDRHSYGVQRLPPGIAKNLARGKPLPPGIAKKRLPGDLLAGLPRHAGYDYVLAGTDVLLVEVATNVVADILRGVVR